MPSPRAAKSSIAEQSEAAAIALKAYLEAHRSPSVRLLLGSAAPQITVPTEALVLFAAVLDQLAQGREVTVEPTLLSVEEAAAVLNVSTSYLLNLLEAGTLPHRGTGAHLHVGLGDLLTYKHRDLTRRRQILADLTAEAQEMGLDY
ncbi:MAG: helix-turn-helix domain-containing protein [Thermoanaerobaculia bacterium]|nr:helix-turn-helix domain-containing protein [Thermoanaerobaculia bacterium]